MKRLQLLVATGAEMKAYPDSVRNSAGISNIPENT
jgi:hypothetical protein